MSVNRNAAVAVGRAAPGLTGTESGYANPKPGFQRSLDLRASPRGAVFEERVGVKQVFPYGAVTANVEGRVDLSGGIGFESCGNGVGAFDIEEVAQRLDPVIGDARGCKPD